MQHSTVFILLIAAAMHASWNILIKRCGERLPLASQWVAIYCGIIAACVLPFVPMPASVSWPYLLASAVLQAAYFFLLALAYRHGDFSVAYPLMRGVAPILVLLVAYIGLGEAIDVHKIIGIVLICTGVLTLLPRGHGPGKSQAYALANAAVIASYTLIDGMGVRLSHSPVAYVMTMFVITALIIAAYCLWHERAHLFAHMRVPIEDITAQNLLMRNGEIKPADIERHVSSWIQAHQAQFDGWVKEAAAAAK